MPLPDPSHPWTEAEARNLSDAWRNGFPVISSFAKLLAALEADPHVVYYRAGRCWYYAPHHFPLLPRLQSPSDCTWIVPGTERWK